MEPKCILKKWTHLKLQNWKRSATTVAIDLQQKGQQAPESHSSRWHGRIECQQATWENLRSTLILICWKNNWEHLFY